MKSMKPDSKVILLGKEAAGKTSLICRYINDTFTASYCSTVGAAFSSKEVEARIKSIVLAIWDTAGSERFSTFVRGYYRNAVAAILCYDMTDKSSFDKVPFWAEKVRQNEMDCKVFLCGTKKDLVDENAQSRKVTFETVTPLVDELQAAAAFETSSKSGENIEQLFKAVAEYCIQKKEEDELGDEQKDSDIVDLTKETGQHKESCRC